MSSHEADARATVKELFSFIERQGKGDYLGEPISQIEHSLQAATLAERAGADDDTIIGALLHDVGRFIPAAEKMDSMVASDGTYIGKSSHEVVGERYLRQLGFSEKICQVVGAHVNAKRYLCAVEKGYWESLSRSSKQTLEFQVSPASMNIGCRMLTRTGRCLQQGRSRRGAERPVAGVQASDSKVG